MTILFDVLVDLADGERADHHRYVVDAVEQEGLLEGKAFHAVDTVEADGRNHQADKDGENGFHLVLGADAGDAAQTDQAQAEVLGALKGQRGLCQHGRRHQHDNGREDGAKRRRRDGQSQRLPCLALLRHRITVERGGDRLRGAWGLEQDRRNRSTGRPSYVAGHHEHDGHDRIHRVGER